MLLSSLTLASLPSWPQAGHIPELFQTPCAHYLQSLGPSQSSFNPAPCTAGMPPEQSQRGPPQRTTVRMMVACGAAHALRPAHAPFCSGQPLSRQRGPHQILRRHRALLGHEAHGLDEVPHAEVALHLDPGVVLAVALLVRGRARHIHQAVGVLACYATHLRPCGGFSCGADQEGSKLGVVRGISGENSSACACVKRFSTSPAANGRRCAASLRMLPCPASLLGKHRVSLVALEL